MTESFLEREFDTDMNFNNNDNNKQMEKGHELLGISAIEKRQGEQKSKDSFMSAEDDNEDKKDIDLIRGQCIERNDEVDEN